MQKRKIALVGATSVLVLGMATMTLANTKVATNGQEPYFGIDVYICKLGKVQSKAKKEQVARRSVLKRCQRRFGKKSVRCTEDAIDCHYM